MLITQQITTRWTKKSRGMPLAKRRNEVPRVLVLPHVQLSEGHFLHEVSSDESEHFGLRHEASVIDFGAKYGCFDYKLTESGIQILFTYNYYAHGQPNRGAYKRPLFTLKKGQVGRFWINGRFASYGGQHYKQHCVNMAHVDDIQPDVFLNVEPAHFVDELAHLF